MRQLTLAVFLLLVTIVACLLSMATGNTYFLAVGCGAAILNGLLALYYA